MSVLGARLYASSYTIQYAAILPAHSKVVSVGIENQGYSYQASLPRNMHKATATLLHSDCAVQLGLILATGW